MLLKVIVSLILFLMPIYADDNNGYEDESLASDVNRVTNESSSSDPDNAKKGVFSKISKWVELSGSFALVTDYIYRGQTQTFGGPAAQGGLTLSQKKDEGFYAGIWGSNVSNTTAPNGAGLELDLFIGYVYKRDDDLSFKLELKNTRYPGAYASLPTKDTYDTLEIIPGVSYKFFTFYIAYSLSGNSGVNQNFAPTFPAFLKPNGNSKGSCYTEAVINVPISVISENLKFRATAGYAYVRNYTKLNYTVFSTGLKYKLPENWGGISIFANASATTANKKYYKVTNSAGKSKNTMAPKIWLGISKKF